MSEIDQRLFRNVSGKFPSGVTVITTESADGVVHGMTANGFLSVSLEPALILVSVGKSTRLHGYLDNNDRYAVSILRHDQTDIARHFAGKPLETEPKLERMGAHPVVPDAISRIGCTIYDRYEAGDHILFLGEVEHLDYQDGSLPLVFSSGQLFSPLERVQG